MSWRFVLALSCLGLSILCFGIAWYGSRHKNPVIRQKPQRDSRADFYRDWK